MAKDVETPSPRSPVAMIYGANGYTGELVAREAVRRGLRPILAGRNAEALGQLARELELPQRVFALDDPAQVAAALAGVTAVLHCAGPFVRTSRPMVQGCLAAGAHYLDITGEITVFERVLGEKADSAARQRGVTLLPGVGFDVVPSDCLAARLHELLPTADHLDLAFVNEGGGWSPGTLVTMIESLPGAGAMRRGGQIVPIAPARFSRWIDLPQGRRHVMSIPWGDVSTAFHTTGIPNIRTFVGAPPRRARALRRWSWLLPIAGWKPIKRTLQRRVRRQVSGPSAEVRDNARVTLWGKAANAAAPATPWVSAILETPEGYALTAASSIECLVRVLAGATRPGSITPARAFGWRLIDSIPGVRWGETTSGSGSGDQPEPTQNR